jgi:threonine dehydrogenase-like Zn-dependent dehydrogenase
MRGLTIIPGKRGSVRLDDVPEPDPKEGSVLVQTLAVGVCGTDHELIDGDYGWPPPGRDRLVIGHESLGRVLEAPSGSGLAKGDIVVGIVRHPDPVPCLNCAVGEWDMCRNGLYTEHGIKQLDGFCRERYRIQPEFTVKLDPSLDRVGVLLEPSSILAKAWEHITKIGERARWVPKKAVITGAGPVGLLGALMGVQRKLEVHVLDRVTDGPKPSLVGDLGAHYHTGSLKEICQDTDVLIECTGVAQLVFDAMQTTSPSGIVCLTGISSGGRLLGVDLGALNRNIVLENDVIFGSVNANRRHYQAAAEALRQADHTWLERLVTRRVPLDHWQDALERRPNDVKVVIDFTL